MEGRNYNQNGHKLQITVTSSYDANFTVTYGPSEISLGNFSVSANTSYPVNVPWPVLEALGSETIQNRGIHLVSDRPVNVYALNWDNRSSDVAVIYPIESIGQDYYAMCYEPHVDENGDGTYNNGRNSEFLIIGTEDNTDVMITPSAETAGGNPAGVKFSVTLNRGQSYQVQSLNRELVNQGDLTGSFIQSTKPVAVYAGNLATSVPNVDPIEAWDHLYEQMPPLYSWGLEYFTVPLMGREADRFRILASEDETTVDLEEYGSFLLNRGEFKEVELDANQASRILADKPIMVAQFSQSHSVDGKTGDPSMIILSSKSQSKNKVTFEAYDQSTISAHYINIVSPTDQVANLHLDGKPIALTGYTFNPFPGTYYSYAQMILPGGTHTLENIDPNEGFLAYVYGFGNLESFGYPVGFNLNIVLDLGGSINFSGDTLLLCPGDTLTLDAGPYFDTYAWTTTEETQSIRVTEEGWYKVTTTVEGCTGSLHDSVFVLKPSLDLNITPDDLSKCSPWEFNLQANSLDAASFLWQSIEGDSLSTDPSLTVDSTAMYRITVWNEYGCSVTDTADVIVFGKPPVTILADSLVCGDLETTIRADLGNYPDSLWMTDPGGFEWGAISNGVTFGDETDSVAVMSVNSIGTFEVFYVLTTKDGCVSGDTIQIVFADGVNAEIQADRFYDCSPATITLNAVTGEPGNYDYLWQSLEGKNLGTLNTLDVDSTARFRLTTINEFGCVDEDTASVIIFGNPPVTIAADSVICGMLSALVEADLSNYPDTLWQNGGHFEWTSNGLTKRNESVSQAVFDAPDYGVYDVYYTITTNDGCVSGDTIQIEFKEPPVADFSFDFKPYCKSYTDTIRFTGSASDQAIFKWDFKYAQVVNLISDREVVLLVHENTGQRPSISLIVEDGPCRDTLYREEPGSFAADRVLTVDFNADPTVGCDSLQTLLTVTDPGGLGSIRWSTDAGVFTGDSLELTFTNAGNYSVSLIADAEESGCTSELTKDALVEVKPSPIADFDIDRPVVSPDNPLVTFYNNSDNSDSYLWIFGDGENSIDYAPQHEYNEVGSYIAWLVASSNLGCKDSTSSQIQVVFNRFNAPNAFRPDSDIPENRVFMPYGLGLNGTNFTLQIYDRWGQVIFETTSAANPWDGLDKGGQEAPMGNYIWMATYSDVEGREHRQKGQILLIR
ncbi:T9SS type B sorting domain-containing protein [Mangrovibacterium lignilyticum]|uniref:T9SS type B sorting domain-containing protein n=1 Tax=Mangrovibacterium lignilyticum TaxID=2668052 RepID=UPI0013D5E6DB|nr:gliding motility-associated C-terminal domain-containing protein [Mangrovibacterium lignilyticum]